MGTLLSRSKSLLSALSQRCEVLTRRSVSQGETMLKKYLPFVAIAVGVVYVANRVLSIRRLIG